MDDDFGDGQLIWFAPLQKSTESRRESCPGSEDALLISPLKLEFLPRVVAYLSLELSRLTKSWAGAVDFIPSLVLTVM